MEQVTGKIKHYLFHNEENSYSIAKIITEEDQIVTIVGYFPKISSDVTYIFSGTWIHHQTYGQQLKVETFKKSEEQSLTGLVSYLSSEYFTGIGPKTAQKIVDLLGVDAIQKIAEDKNILKEVGLGPIRINNFYQQLLEHQTSEHILVALYGYDLSGKLAAKLLSKYQLLTLEKIEENPYRLIDDIEGIGFIKADEIARKIGIDLDHPKRLKAALLYAIELNAYQIGHLYMEKDALFEQAFAVLGEHYPLEDALGDLIFEQKIVHEDNRYYLYTTYEAENVVAKKLLSLADRSDFKTDLEYLETLLSAVEVEKNIQYTNVQKEAILTALVNPISVITGGPGTGKTTIIDGLLEVYRIYHKLNFKDPAVKEKIALMAPTGRAAKRMKELLNFEAKTIHRHLGYTFEGFFNYDQDHTLPHRLIIIDEASMIDLFLARRLFEAIDINTQVIIVGDVDQLPSVGPGQILSDLIEAAFIPVTYLNEIHRQAKDSKIISLARAINNQEVRGSDLESDQDVYLYRAEPQKIKDVMIRQIKGAIEQGYHMIDDIQILAPMYKGELGIDSLNQLLQAAFNPSPSKQIKYGDKSYGIGDKIIQLVNDPERDIMNGDVGIVKDIRKTGDDEDILVASFDERDVIYYKADLDELNLAYTISIHKSQGSEYKIVILPMVKNFLHMLKKELIYTAVTRAKKYLMILGDMQLLIYASNHRSEKRKTTLAMRLGSVQHHLEDELSPYDFMEEQK